MTQEGPRPGHVGQPTGIWAHRTASKVDGSAQHITEDANESSIPNSGASTEDHARVQEGKKGTTDGRQQIGGRQSVRTGRDRQVRCRRQGGVFRRFATCLASAAVLWNYREEEALAANAMGNKDDPLNWPQGKASSLWLSAKQGPTEKM